MWLINTKLEAISKYFGFISPIPVLDSNKKALGKLIFGVREVVVSRRWVRPEKMGEYGVGRVRMSRNHQPNIFLISKNMRQVRTIEGVVDQTFLNYVEQKKQHEEIQGRQKQTE